MLSKSQAEAASEAMLESGRQQRDKQSPVLVRFPELADIPFSERAPMVKAAHQSVWRRWPLRVLVGGVIASASLWSWTAIMKLEIAADTWWVPFLAALISHRMSQRLVRRELRRALARRGPQDQ